MCFEFIWIKININIINIIDSNNYVLRTKSVFVLLGIDQNIDIINDASFGHKKLCGFEFWRRVINNTFFDLLLQIYQFKSNCLNLPVFSPFLVLETYGEQLVLQSCTNSFLWTSPSKQGCRMHFFLYYIQYCLQWVFQFESLFHVDKVSNHLNFPDFWPTYLESMLHLKRSMKQRRQIQSSCLIWTCFFPICILPDDTWNAKTQIERSEEED